MRKTEVFSFDSLPKLSQNEALAMHWGKRKKIRSIYEGIILHLVNKRFGKKLYCANADVKYHFIFNEKPLDCLNCAEMIKFIEDIIFLKDDPKHVRSIEIRSEENPEIKTKMYVSIVIEYEEWT